MNVTCFNPVIIRILYFIFLTILINIGSYSQQINTEKIDFKNLILKKNIKSVKLHLEGWELSEPVMILNSDTKLILSFDDLGTEINDYSYTIIHCNSEWEPENLFMEEYIDGYHEGYIANYKKSFNTTYNYFHYSLTIPNQDMSIKISGNYCIVVYQNYNPDDIVLIKRFCVVENLVDINPQLMWPKNYPNSYSGQEVLFTVGHEEFNIDDPSQVKVVLLQNFRWDSPEITTQPLFVKPGMLDYSFDNKFVFDGCNEFREFDIKSIKYSSKYVNDILFKNPYYHVYLNHDHSRFYDPYFFKNDLNGKYYVDIQEGIQKEIEADYVYVYFSLDYPEQDDGNIYIYGELTGWNLASESEMEYNYKNSQYEKSLLLKQGFYNYIYAYKKRNDDKTDISLIEGSHFETENDYYIFVYYQDYTSNYERIIGYKKINTLNDK